MCGSGSTKLLSTDPIWSWIHTAPNIFQTIWGKGEDRGKKWQTFGVNTPASDSLEYVEVLILTTTP